MVASMFPWEGSRENGFAPLYELPDLGAREQRFTIKLLSTTLPKKSFLLMLMSRVQYQYQFFWDF